MYGFRVWVVLAGGRGPIYHNVTEIHCVHGEEVYLTSSCHDEEACYAADIISHFYMRPEAKVRETFQARIEQGD